MKTSLVIRVASLASMLASAATGAVVDESAVEFTSSGDFNADGFADVVVVQKDTGVYRVGYGAAGGSFTWGQPQSGGVAGVTAIATGRVNSTTQDSVFFASVDANRITFVTPANAAYNAHTDFMVAGVGPKIIAGIDIPSAGNTAHLDLVTGSVLNPVAQSSSLRTYRSTGNNTIAQIGSVSSTEQWLRAMTLKPNTAAAEMVLVQRSAGTTEAFTMYSVASGTPSASVIGATGLPAGSFIVFGNFDSSQTDIFSWVPGSPAVVARRINAGANGFASTITRTLPQAVQQLVVIHNGTTSQVLCLHTNGSVVVYNYTAATGFTAAATLTLPAGSGVPSGATATANGSFQLFFAPAAGQASSSMSRFAASGGVWASQGSQTLPRATAIAGQSNVLFLNAPPFVTASPQVLKRTSVGDWTELVTASGSPVTATASWRDDLGAATGLGAVTFQSLGNTPGGFQHVLYNQWRPTISLFWMEGLNGVVNEEVRAVPAGGTFAESVAVTLSSRNAASTIYFRTNPAAPFVAYSGAIVLYGDTTLETYALTSGQPSAVQKLTYRFIASPDRQDADSDGVPDFVERSLGLNPRGGQDTDGDGFSDLEELLAGTNLNNALNKPLQHDDSAARFDISATIAGLNGVTNALAAPENGEELTARDVLEAQLGVGTTAGGNGTVNVSATPVESDLRILTLATAANYPLIGAVPDADIGREIVGLVNVPDGVSTEVPFTYDFNAGAAQPAAWIAAAQAAYSAVNPGSVTTTLSSTDTLVTALYEWGLTELARQRGYLAAGEQLCFTKWRAGDAIDNALQALTPTELRSLETPPSPAVAATTPCVLTRESLTALNAAVESPAGADLRAVAQEIYRISSCYGNDSPGTYEAPLDALRFFIWSGALPAGYAAESALPAAQVTAARNSILPLVQSAVLTRPLTTVAVGPAALPVAGATAVDSVPAGPRYALIDALGRPFELPETFDLPSGSVMTVTGYTDRPARKGLATIEVTSVTVNSLAAPTPADTDGNLLPDAWELAFFGAIGQDPMTSGDGSGYSKLQEYFEGTDPGCATDSPATPPVFIGPSNVRVTTLGPVNGAIRLEFDFPAAYASRVRASFAASDNLDSWVALPEATATATGFSYQTSGSLPRQFFRGQVRLR